MTVKISELCSDRFVGLFRQIKEGVWRLTDIGIKGYENEYWADGDIVVELDGVAWGDELIIRNDEFVYIKSTDEENSFNQYC
jgi:hypothetical protein